MVSKHYFNTCVFCTQFIWYCESRIYCHTKSVTLCKIVPKGNFRQNLKLFIGAWVACKQTLALQVQFSPMYQLKTQFNFATEY